MKNSMQRQIGSKLLYVIMLSGFAIGCATSGKSTDSAQKADLAAEKASREYVNDLALVALEEKPAAGVKCINPFEVKSIEAKGSVQVKNKDWKMMVNHANACTIEKNWRTLEGLANAMARSDVDSPWGAYFLSLSAEGLGDLHRANWMADLAQKKAGGKVGLFSFQKGRLLFALKETSLAMQEIESALKLDPSLVEGHLFLGSIYRRDGELERAEKLYMAALNVDQKHLKALTSLAEIKLERNLPAEAAEFYTRLVSARPEILQAWLRLAFIYETLEKNGSRALATYKSLRNSIAAGSVVGRPDFDLNAKISALEQSLQPRTPAQAKAEVSSGSSNNKTLK